MTEERINELFKRYKESGDITIRNQIAEHYLYITEILAKKFVGRGVEYDDLQQIAAMALVRGIDRFDVDQGVQFSTFITPTIAGEIKNYFRDNSRMIKVPRRLGELNLAVRKFSLEYEKENGDKPKIKKIAQVLNVEEEDVVKALEIGGTVSLDGMMTASDEDNDKSLYGVLASGEDGYEQFETQETLSSAMQDFSDEEKALVKYRFVDGLSQSDTAKKLGGKSQMYVSRMERRLLEKLKDRLKDVFN
ncbi:MAG: sigma-70 family RNA polymerase sigma factor [Clostridia bacterium]|nr:sigma-70 family RNA polymerase sigma factor [Clostridia bacterium]